ncbi:MAG: SDR family oxidoreductase [Amphritea sp.]
MTTDKVAIVTAAGKGIGAAIARRLKHSGYQLVLMSPSENCIALADELGATAVQGSTASASDLEGLVQHTVDRFGRIDAVVNHTGHPPKGDLLEISDEQWAQGHEMLLQGVIRMAKLVTPYMESQGSGSIVNITTYASSEPELIFPVSCVYRAGIASFTKLYSDRYAAAGIRMNCALPGFIDSLDHSQTIADRVPMKRIGKVDEFAATVEFLLSDDAGYITGQNIRVDGGITRHI